ncbi:CENP-B N-terminal DNA-binding domain [Popillia japonica]|uniref:CENP-B N-terminal DNA-binding domain n=1 Tax=Popillia japonica TaxID=7064 RepID=A0AAW1M002_POPJA
MPKKVALSRRKKRSRHFPDHSSGIKNAEFVDLWDPKGEYEDILRHKLYVEHGAVDDSKTIIGNRIVDIHYSLTETLKVQYNHSKQCTNGLLKPFYENNKGLASITTTLKCRGAWGNHGRRYGTVSGEVRSRPLYKMPRYYQRKTETRYRLEDLKKAIQDVNNKTLSLGKAATTYSVPKSTIHDHLKKEVIKEPKTRRKAIFSDEQERELEEHIIKCKTILWFNHSDGAENSFQILYAQINGYI